MRVLFLFSEGIAACVNIPVFMFSLLRIPWAQQVIGLHAVVGILISCKDVLQDEHLINIGVELGSNYVIGRVMDDNTCPQFHSLWTEGVRPEIPQALYKKAEKEFM